MTFDVTPDSLRQASFRNAFRGYDPAEVESMLAAAAVKLEQLDAQRRKLKSQLDELPGNDLEKEFEAVGDEVASILQSAREAADSMRHRASGDAARWRNEATEEAETLRREAAADAEALRRDAWVTGSELLEQTMTAAEDQRANAERDVLTVMGEAEREAHRLTSGARREAEDMIRNATMDSEKITADARTRRDEIIDQANRQAATAQERTRALEQRREELLEELENVRSTLTRLEGSLEERREALDLTVSKDTSVRVVHPPADAKKQWELGETVRVVPPNDAGAPDPDPDIADQLSDQVSRLQEEPESRAEPEPASAPEPAGEEPTQPEPEPPPPDESDELDALFASLRTGGDPAVADGAPVTPDEADVASQVDEEVTRPDKTDEAAGTDWIEVREAKLLPITNRALRGVKKAMTEVQNIALDSLRTDDGWSPDVDAIARSVHAEIVGVWSESFAAGHAAAGEMSGKRVKRPPTPDSDADRQFAADLGEAVAAAVTKAGDSARERQAAASRIFRVWRSDEAERRIRDIALRGYESGLEKTGSVTTV